MNAAKEHVSPASGQRIGTRHLLLYILPILLFPILFLSLAFFVIPSHWFIAHSGNDYLANLGYGDQLVHSDCQILIYGDSTAMVGANALLLKQETGLKACNIAEFYGMTALYDTQFVDRYLAHNPAPRFIIFIYAPDNLRRPADWGTFSTFEAITYGVGSRHDLETASLLIHHLPSTLGWAEQGLRMSLFRMRSKPLEANRYGERAPINGQFYIPGKVMKVCDPKGEFHTPPDPTWIKHLRSYNTSTTQVLVVATPQPPCNFGLAYYQQVLPGMVDDIPYPVYPLASFMEGYHLHLSPAGAIQLSHMMADEIKTRMATSGTASSPSQPLSPLDHRRP